MNERLDIYSDLKNRILTVDLIPGLLLSENQLASEYGVSRTPIRQVLQQLSNEGLVVIIPQKGTYVTKISISRVADVMFLRKCIEPEIFKIACKHKDQIIEELEAIVTKQRELQTNDLKDFNYLDNQFHYILFSVTDYERIHAIIDEYSNHYNRLRVLFEHKYDIKDKVAEHEEIIELLKNDDYKSYKLLLDKHMEPLNTIVESHDYGFLNNFIKE